MNNHLASILRDIAVAVGSGLLVLMLSGERASVTIHYYLPVVPPQVEATVASSDPERPAVTEQVWSF